MLSRREPVKCFALPQRSHHLRYIGMRTVELDRVVGSVGRCKELKSGFRFRRDSSRIRRIKAALERGTPMPAIELYKLGEDYYVLDGNHRVAAAKEIGQAYIEAEVIEYVLSEESPGNSADVSGSASLGTQRWLMSVVAEGREAISQIADEMLHACPLAIPHPGGDILCGNPERLDHEGTGSDEGETSPAE